MSITRADRSHAAPDAVRDGDLPPPVHVAPHEHEPLLDLARAAVRVAAGAAPPAALDDALGHAATIERCGGAFVTLTEDGELRGCVGSLDPDRPLTASVVAAATMAAARDPRFEPVRAAELARLHLEVSVLGPFVEAARPERLRPGVDGVLVERGWHRGLLLPEVAPMLGVDAQGLLEATCRKAGLPPGAWREAATTVRLFRTVRFGGSVEPD